VVDASKILRGVSRVAGGALFGLFLAALIGQVAFVQLTDASTLRPIVTQTLSPQITAQLQSQDLIQAHGQAVQLCTQGQQLNITTFTLTLGGEQLTFNCQTDIIANNATTFALLASQKVLVASCDRTGGQTTTLSYANQSVTLNCAAVRAATPQQVPDLVLAAGFDSIYSKSYPACSGLKGLVFNCLMKIQSLPDDQKTFIISKQANDTIKNVTNYIYAGMIAGLALIVYSIRTWHKILRNVGVTLLIAGVPYFFIGSFKSLVPLPAGLSQAITPIVDSIFSALSQYFLYAFVIGVALTAAGYVGKFFFAKKEKQGKAEKKK